MDECSFAHAVTNHLKNAAEGPGVDTRLVAGAFHAEGLTCSCVHAKYVHMCTLRVGARVYVYACVHTHALIDIHIQK